MTLLRSSVSLAALALAMTPAIAFAQTAPAPEPAEATSLVDELVVTAQKREQNLQDVPIVVTTIGQKQLQEAGVRDIKDLMLVTPGLNVSSTANESSTVARIRGVGTIGDNAGLESSVGIVIDGVYRPRASTGIGDLGELARVEVLKGPQGTLFGKNTSAGVINVITAAPSDQFAAKGEATFGNYNAREVAGSVTGPIVGDTLSGRLYAAVRKRDGFNTVRTGLGPRTNTDDNERNYYTVRGQLMFRPDTDVSVRVIADYPKRDEVCCGATTYVRGPAADDLDLAAGTAATLNPVDRDSRTVYANRDGPNEVTDMGLSAETEWKTPWLNNASLTSVTAWRNWKTEIGQEADFSAADLIYRRTDGSFSTEFDQFSQEFRLAGEAGPVNWLVGLFYAREDLQQHTPLVFGTDLEEFLSYRFSGAANIPTYLATVLGMTPGTVFTPGAGYDDRYHQKSNTLALFTNNSWKITDHFEATLGLRYTTEDKSVDADYRNVGNTGDSCRAALTRGLTAFYSSVCATFNDFAFNNYSPAKQKQENDELTGTLKLAYKVNDDILTYVSYARGYKSGGFNFDRARTTIGVAKNDTFFAPEYVDSYELGAKTTLANGNLLVNASLFYQEFENFQLNTYDGISYKVSSIPLVVSRGIDTEINWRTPIDGLSIQGGLTYAETQYGDFTPAAGVPVRLPNSRLSGAPLYSGALSASYDRDIGSNLNFRASVNARYSSSYNTGSDLNPIKVQDGFALFNARVGLGAANDRWRVELWGANLTDETYAQVIFDPSLQTGSYNAIYAPPRTYGVTLRLAY